MKKTIYIVVFVVLILAVAAAVYYNYHEKAKVAKVATSQISNQPKPQYAVAGKLVSGLPSQLVVGAAPAVDASYYINYAASTQSTAVYQTSTSIASLYNDYLTYFKSNKYEVLSKSDSSKLATIYAIDSTSDINVLIVPSQTKGQNSVTVSYLKK